MKKHLFGFCIALFTFFGSFYLSPIWFSSIAIAHGFTMDGGKSCGFYPQISSHFVELFANSCDYTTNEKATENINNKVAQALKVIEPVREIELEDGRKIQRTVLFSRFDDKHYFCIIITNDNWVDDICSTSYQHVIEFEQQKYPAIARFSQP